MATLTRWNPTNGMVTLRDAMDRLLADSFVRPWSNLIQPIESAMPIDMYEEKDHLVVKTALPGVKPDDVTIEVQDNVLNLSGEIKEENNQSENGGQPKSMGNKSQTKQTSEM